MRTAPLTAALVLASLGRAAVAAPPVDPTAPATVGELSRIDGELARMEQELREQRQLIFQILQMHDVLLKYMATGGSAPPADPASSGGAGTPAPAATGPADAAAAGNTGLAVARGTVSGRVRSTGPALGETYVYIDGPRSLAAHPQTVEIKQLGRQFIPSVSVVQTGARVTFPNEDKIFHNVFSRTPGDAFDLGTVRAGDKPTPVVLLKPGHVEVFCNIHSRMRADILVVPNSYWAKVRQDGTYQIPGVPAGPQRVVMWGPTVKTVAQRVEVTPAGATVNFSADILSRGPHSNKQGGAYESYDE